VTGKYRTMQWTLCDVYFSVVKIWRGTLFTFRFQNVNFLIDKGGTEGGLTGPLQACSNR
jgi:hypothetical protein